MRTKDYGSYFGRFAQPFLFVFGTASVVLGAMQVVLAARQDIPPSRAWSMFSGVAQWFSVGCIAIVGAIIFGFFAIFVLLLMRELLFALGKLAMRDREEEKGSGFRKRSSPSWF